MAGILVSPLGKIH